MDEQLQKVLQDQLRDVQLPDAVGWWPLSTAWWFVIGLTVFAIAYLGYRLVRKRRQNRYRKAALQELKRHFSSWQNTQNNSDFLHYANQLLKRCVIRFNPAAAKLSGAAWATTLAQHCASTLSEKTQFALSHSVYQASPEVDVVALHHELSQWIKRHSAEAAYV